MTFPSTQMWYTDHIQPSNFSLAIHSRPCPPSIQYQVAPPWPSLHLSFVCFISQCLHFLSPLLCNFHYKDFFIHLAILLLIPYFVYLWRIGFSLIVFILVYVGAIWSGRDCSVVKTSSSCREPEFGYQYPRGNVSPSVTLVLRDRIPSSDLGWHLRLM